MQSQPSNSLKPTGKARILVVDDEANARTALAELLRDEGYEVETAGDAFKALGKLDDFSPHLILTDLKMPGMDGIELLAKVRELDPNCPVAVMTAFGEIETAIQAMRAGAAHYLTKPIDFDELLLISDRILEQRRLRVEASSMRARLAERDRLNNIIGSSEPMKRIYEIVQQVAPSRASALITGESGTGKELIAAALHQHSQRADGPFIKVHCAALAETLLESELFGHERGAFTGAVNRRDGRFQHAHGGTLFLDEIGEISPSIQVKLLRFLQEHEFERVGSDQTIKVDVRIITATNRDLAEEVRAGRFREDLYYRLNVVTIEMPALRDRRSDIPLLAQFFLRKYANENAKDLEGLSSDALDILTAYDWPGNVRELENTIERGVVLSRGNLLEASVLPPHLAQAASSENRGGTPEVPGSTLADIERYAILKTLESTGGSTSKAADILGISVRKIQYKLQEYRAAPKSNTDVVTRAATAGGKDTNH